MACETWIKDPVLLGQSMLIYKVLDFNELLLVNDNGELMSRYFILVFSDIYCMCILLPKRRFWK